MLAMRSEVSVGYLLIKDGSAMVFRLSCRYPEEIRPSILRYVLKLRAIIVVTETRYIKPTLDINDLIIESGVKKDNEYPVRVKQTRQIKC